MLDVICASQKNVTIMKKKSLHAFFIFKKCLAIFVSFHWNISSNINPIISEECYTIYIPPLSIEQAQAGWHF